MSKEEGWTRIKVSFIKTSNQSQSLRSAPYPISVREKTGMITWVFYVLEMRRVEIMTYNQLKKDNASRPTISWKAQASSSISR